MPPDPRPLAEWTTTLTIDGVTHQVVIVARGEDDIRAKISQASMRQVPAHYTCLHCHGADSLIVDWGQVREWSTEGAERGRSWGPQ